MSNLLNQMLSFEFLASIIRISTPLILAALAATLTSRAGVSNIGIEGTMSITALCAVIFSWATGSLLAGVLGAIAVGILLSLMIGFFAFELRTNISLCGIAINTLGEGGAVLLMYMVTGMKSDTAVLGAFKLPTFFDGIPVVGGHSVLTYITYLLVFVVWVLLYKTPLGVRMRAVGENPNAAESVGVGVNRIRYLSLVLCGVLAGMAGAYMSMSYMTMFSKNMIAGRGFIALAAEAMGHGEPLGVMLSAMLFGFAQASANYIKGTNLPAQLVDAIPYVITIVGLAIYAAVTLEHTRKAKNREFVGRNDRNSK